VTTGGGRGTYPGVRVLEYLGEATLGTGNVQRGRAEIYYKAPMFERPFEILNEFICNRLAIALSLSCPLGDIGRLAADELAWISFAATQDGETIAPPDIIDEVAVKYPDFAAGVLVFDEWVMNYDRTDENIIWFPGMTPYVIDHGEALFTMRQQLTQPDGPYTPVTASHAFRGHVSADAVSKWIGKVNALSLDAITEPLAMARSWGLVSADDARSAATLLDGRRRWLTPMLRGSAPVVSTGASTDPDLFSDEGGDE
jgi:hypothetical protein